MRPGSSDPATLDAERKTNLADVTLDETGAGGFLASRFLLDRKPFNDDRVRRAIHLAIDRAALVDALYPPMDGRAVRAAHRPDRAGHASAGPSRPHDLRVASRAIAADRGGPRRRRSRREAALGTRAAGAATVDLRIVFAGVPKAIPERAVERRSRASSPACWESTSTPGTVDASGYAVIASALGGNIDGATEGVAPFTLMFEDGGVDIDSWLFPHFRSGQPMNTYRLQDPQLDALLDKSRRRVRQRGAPKVWGWTSRTI